VIKLIALLVPAALCAQVDAHLQQGRWLFRSNCAFCHGLTATGGRGPNLVSAPLSHGDTDDSIKRVIRSGVPGTTMPAFSDLTDEEIAQIIDYLRSLSSNSNREVKLPGDPDNGRHVYTVSGCSGCHRIEGQGSIFGPELTRIGAARSIDYIRESIVRPSADVPDQYAGVTVILKNGQRIQGIRINEDTFSIQLRGSDQKFRMYEKDELRQVIDDKQSLMPAYNHLSPADLDNLVSYLATLRGAVDTAARVRKAGGIK
jgi:putative heme-binding domain-containing protein